MKAARLIVQKITVYRRTTFFWSMVADLNPVLNTAAYGWRIDSWPFGGAYGTVLEHITEIWCLSSPASPADCTSSLSSAVQAEIHPTQDNIRSEFFIYKLCYRRGMWVRKLKSAETNYILPLSLYLLSIQKTKRMSVNHCMHDVSSRMLHHLQDSKAATECTFC